MNWERTLKRADLMTAGDVAEYLAVPESAVLDWARNGLLPSCGSNGGYLFNRRQVDRWLSGCVEGLRTARAFPLETLASPERVAFMDGGGKKEALEALLGILASAPNVKDPAGLAEAIFRREKVLSTGAGLGIAFPHAVLPSVEGIAMAVGICRKPIPDYASLDGQPVRLILMVAAGRDYVSHLLRLMSVVSGRLRDEGLRDRLMGAEDSEEACRLLRWILAVFGDRP